MKTGIVMELDGGTAVVLQNGGGFVKLPAGEGWQKGDVVPVAPARKKALRFPRALVAAAACLVLLAAAGFGAYGYYTPTSLISIDVNPSVELSLNRFGRVVSASGYNPDGEALLDSVPVKGDTYQQAVEKLLASRELQGYLQGNATLAFSAYSSTHEKELLAYLDGLTAGLEETYPDSEFVCDGVARQLVEDAHEHGLTPGRMNAILQLQALDPTAEIDDYKDLSMREIRKRLKELSGESDEPGQGQQANADGQGAGGGQGASGGQGAGGGQGTGQGTGGGQGHGSGSGSGQGRGQGGQGQGSGQGAGRDSGA